MTREELEQLKYWLESEIGRRNRLGGYSQDAETITNLFEVALKLARHLKPEKPKKRKK